MKSFISIIKKKINNKMLINLILYFILLFTLMIMIIEHLNMIPDFPVTNF